MAKWADYLISQVSYDQDHIITKIMQHRDIGNKISGGEIVDRNVIATNLGHGAKYMTVFGDLGKIRMGKNVRYYRAYDSHYIRICLLYTSDAADDLLCVDLGGRRIIKKK